MASPIVGSAQVLVEPSFKGSQKTISANLEGEARKAGTSAGRQLGDSMAAGAKPGLDQLEAQVTRAQRASVDAADKLVAAKRKVATANDAEQDSLAKLKIAQQQLTEAEAKYEAGSSQVLRAKQKVVEEERRAISAAEDSIDAIKDLERAQADASDKAQDLARAQKEAGDAATDAGRKSGRFAKDLDDSTDAVERQERALGKLKDAARVALAAVGVAAAAVVTQAVSAASEAEQTTGGAEAMFGPDSEAVQERASASVMKHGVGASDYRRLATQFGAFGKNLGKQGEDLVAWVDEQVTLAADLAATYGRTPEEAAEAILSAFRGESDPIEAFGGIDTRVENTKKYGEGVGGIEAAIRDSEGAKAAQGMAAEEADTFEGSKNRLGGWAQGKLAEIGAPLKDGLAQLMTAIVENVDPAIEQIIGAFQRWRPEIMATAAATGVLLAALLWTPTMTAAATAVNILRTSLNALKTAMLGLLKNPLVIALAAIAAALVYAWQANEEFRKVVLKAWSEIQAALAPVVPMLVEAFGALMSGVAPVLGWLLATLATIVAWVVINFLPPLVDVLTVVIGWLAEKVPAAAAFLWEKIQQFIGFIAPFVSVIVNAVVGYFRFIFEMWTVHIPNAAKSLYDAVARWFAAVRTFVSNIVAAVLAVVRSMVVFWTVTVPDAARSMYSAVVSWFGRLRSGIGSVVDQMLSKVRGFKDYLVGGFVNGVKSAVRAVGDAWRGVANKFRAPIQFVVDKVYTNGIKKMFDSVAEAVKSPLRLPAAPKIDAYAKGGPVRRRGVALVGEEGPELVFMNRGHYVATAKETQALTGEGRKPLDRRTHAGPIGGPAGDFFETIKDLASDAFAVLADPGKAFRGLTQRLLGGMQEAGRVGSIAKDTALKLARTVAEGLAAKLGNMFGDDSAPMPMGGGGGPLGSTWRSLWAAIGPMAQSLGLRMTSNYRPGARTAGYKNTSRHALGKAVDIAGPTGAMASMVKWLDAKYGSQLYELIYTPLNGLFTRYRGRRYRESNPVTNRMHYNHLHASVADVGGVLADGEAHVNLSGRPEYTLNPQDTAAFFDGMRELKKDQNVPAVFNLFDVDNELIGRMRGEADGRVIALTGAGRRWG